jgi:hypothetical protein
MNDRQQAILKAVHRELTAILARGPISGWGQVRAKVDYADAMQGCVACRPAEWFGRKLTGAEAKQTSRDCAELEKLGLVERVAWGRSETKTTHLFITAAGLAAVAELEAASDG